MLAAPAEKRYRHFVKSVADRRSLWGLYGNGWALVATDEGLEAIALWPAREFATAYVQSGDDGEPRQIDLQEFLDGWLPNLKARNLLVAVLPTPTGKGVVPTLKQLEADIRHELSLIEDPPP